MAFLTAAFGLALLSTQSPRPSLKTDTLFAEDFESGTLAAWMDGVDPKRQRVVQDPNFAQSGSHYLEVTYPAGSDGGWLTRFLTPGRDSLYVSFYVRFAAMWRGGTKLVALYGSRTDTIVNCPIVPKGSTAKLRYDATESAALTLGWYRDQVVYYFNFELALVAASGKVPTSPIYVTFNKNPADPGGGPASGFVVETGTAQTHNVPATLPGEPGYSPLWAVHIYDNAAFASVMNLDTATAAKLLEPNGPSVNCPIVSVQ